MQDLTTQALQLLTEQGFALLAALAILIIGRWVAGIVRGMVRRAAERAGADATLVPFFANLAYAALLTGVFIGAAAVLGIPTGSFIAIVGAAGLAVALAFQGTLSHLASGVMLLTFRPFNVGDFVDAGGTAGTVKEIGVFTTTMATPDNVKIIVPNSQISSSIIRNFSAYDTRRIDLVIGVSYDDDLDLARSTIEKIVRADDRVLEEPAVVVEVDNLGASSVDLVVRPWVKSSDYWAAKWALTKALKEGVEAAGLSFPYPQRDVHHHNADAAAD
jgi:small conductance mechanosensitive channel